MMDGSKLEHQMQKITRRLEDVERYPATTLDIIGREKQEEDWEAFLVYFLDSDKPHGFGTDILKAFLRGIADHNQTSIASFSHDLEGVKVESQVPTGAGPVDILLWLRDEWYVCIEMKVKSPETGEQTVRYAEAPMLGELRVNKHDGVSDYVYLAPEDAISPTNDDFVQISWSHMIKYLEHVLDGSYGQYPAKSTAQLTDYLDTIKRELHMDELRAISEETVLYIEHSETINRIMEQYQADKDKLYNSLRDRFFSGSECEREDWKVSNRTERYIKFYKREWHDLEGGTKFEYEPHIKLDQSPPTIRLRLDVESGNKEKVRDALRGRLDEKKLEDLEKMGWEFTDGSYSFMAKSITIDLDSPQKSIDHASQELHKFRDIVEPHIDHIASEY